MIGFLIDACFSSSYAFENIIDTDNSIDFILNKLNLYLLKHESTKTICFIKDIDTPEHYSHYFNSIIKVRPDTMSYCKYLLNNFSDCDYIIIIKADNPLVDFNILDKLLSNMKDEIAEYGFLENYPKGIGAEIITLSAIKKILFELERNNSFPFQEGFILKIIEKDINSYDIETIVSDYDMRKYRLEYVANNKLNLEIIKNTISKSSKSISELDYSEIQKIIHKYPETMRSLPAYFEIEITNRCNSTCIFCPRINMKRTVQSMDIESYAKLIKEISNFTEDAVVCFSLMGEPTLHEHLLDFIQLTSSYEKIKLIIETNGRLFNKSLSESISQLKYNNLTVIFSIDSNNSVSYSNLRCSDDYNQVENNISFYLENNPNSYIQFVRMKDNEDEIIPFLDHWKDFKDRIIFQKYNSYCNKLEDRKSVDISPLKRFPCWHLKRDMIIFSNGDVPICKQDFNGTNIIGNVFSENIATIWNKLEADYLKHFSLLESDFPHLCKDCDEWFTYNF